MESDQLQFAHTAPFRRNRTCASTEIDVRIYFLDKFKHA
jgi:hypothetical protein